MYRRTLFLPAENLMQLIGHIDSDCFYVSCERVRRPELRGIPVGVLSNQGACVIAKSYELKRAGISTAMAIWEAQPLCPEAIFVKRDFEWYEAISRQLLAIVSRISPQVEYYSIDEQFFNARYLESFFGSDLNSAIAQFQKMVWQEIGIPVSIGIAPTKTIAKLISKASKPYGYGVMTDAQKALCHFADTPVDAITGIASRSKKKLLGYGIRTCKDFATADRTLIRKLLTVTGEALWWEMQGTPTQPILTDRPPNKMISRGGSVGKATAQEERLLAWITRNTERLIEALDYHQVCTDRLMLILRSKSGLSFSKRYTLPQSSADFTLLIEAGQNLFYDLWSRGRSIRQMHLIAENLSFRSAFQQQSLFHAPHKKGKQLAKVKQEINQKIGRFALRSGSTLPLYELYHDEASNHETSDIYGTTCF